MFQLSATCHFEDTPSESAGIPTTAPRPRNNTIDPLIYLRTYQTHPPEADPDQPPTSSIKEHKDASITPLESPSHQPWSTYHKNHNHIIHRASQKPINRSQRKTTTSTTGVHKRNHHANPKKECMNKRASNPPPAPPEIHTYLPHHKAGRCIPTLESSTPRRINEIG